MKKVKNPEALRRFNNYLLTQEMRNDYLEEMKKSSKKMNNRSELNPDNISFTKTKAEIDAEIQSQL